MSSLIRAKVARILNSREIAITAGEDSRVKLGMYFDVMEQNGEDITDPDSGEVLGSIDRPKVRVKVTQVYEKISVASTFKKKVINVGGESRSVGALSRSLMPPRYVTKYETLKTKEKTSEDLSEKESYVKTGDPVVEVPKSLVDE